MQGLRHPLESPPAPGEAIEIAEGILWMRLPLPMALDHVNVYALDDGAGWTLVDTGMMTRKTIALWEALLAGPLVGKPVTRLIVTHHHPDHIGLAGWFQARGVELVITRTAWLLARMLVLDVQETPPPESLRFYQRAGVTGDDLAARSAQRPFNFADCVAPLPLGFTRLSETEVIHAGGRRWRVRIGQGHAPDHATLWSLDDPLILGGDQLLPGISANIGVYPTEPEADPLGDWLDSTRAFMGLSTDDHLVLPGHKLPFTGLPFRLVQIEENHLTALARLQDHLAESRRAADCFAPLFRRDIGEDQFGLALVEAVAHLNHLLRQGAISRFLDAQGAWLWQAGKGGADADRR